MKPKGEIKKAIPSQKKGGSSDTCHSIKLNSKQDSKDFYIIVRKRLLDVSTWHKLAGSLSARFVIFDSAGNKVRRLIREGDYIRINIPAPGNKVGNGFDWVRLEKIVSHHQPEKDLEQLSFRVRPSSNPTKQIQTTAHFFDKSASSTFLVQREANIITAEIHGRNELPNLTQEVSFDSVRNAFIAIGAIFGLSKVQWSKLVKGLVNKTNPIKT